MMEHKGTLPMETKRLILRPFEACDAEAAFRNWSNRGIVNACIHAITAEDYFK